MTTAAEVKTIVGNYSAEADRVSLQPSALLVSGEGRDQLAAEIVALANRDGGRVVLGVDRQGRFEEQLACGAEAARAAVAELAGSRVSPALDVELELLTGEEGDLIVLKVPRRQAQPHAVGRANTRGSVRSRGFLVRRGGQARPVSDAQLAWMFRVLSDPAVEVEFPLSIHTIPGSLVPSTEVPQLRAVESFERLVAGLDPDLAADIAADPDRRQNALVELAAWAFLDEVPALLVESDARESISLDELPVPTRGSEFAALDGGLRALLGGAPPPRGLRKLLGRRHESRRYVLPTECEMQVDALPHQQKVRLMLNHPAWIVTFAARAAGAGEGLELAGGAESAAADRLAWTRLALTYSCSFPFPETDEAAHARLGFPERLRRHLETGWNSERFAAALAPRWIERFGTYDSSVTGH